MKQIVIQLLCFFLLITISIHISASDLPVKRQIEYIFDNLHLSLPSQKSIFSNPYYEIILNQFNDLDYSITDIILDPYNPERIPVDSISLLIGIKYNMLITGMRNVKISKEELYQISLHNIVFSQAPLDQLLFNSFEYINVTPDSTSDLMQLNYFDNTEGVINAIRDELKSAIINHINVMCLQVNQLLADYAYALKKTEEYYDTTSVDFDIVSLKKMTKIEIEAFDLKDVQIVDSNTVLINSFIVKLNYFYLISFDDFTAKGEFISVAIDKVKKDVSFEKWDWKIDSKESNPEKVKEVFDRELFKTIKKSLFDLYTNAYSQ